MTKIAISPNVNGTGTFTLAAPDSNTNRTLTLPDEAGKILSTGNNDPAEVFNQSNILGTVSQSSGVPTGAIIQRGSNANGEFVRFADGTMICTDRIPIDVTANTLKTATFVYSSSFIGSPRLTYMRANVSGNLNATMFVLCTNNVSATQASIHIRSEITQQERIGCTAIGRWY